MGRARALPAHGPAWKNKIRLSKFYMTTPYTRREFLKAGGVALAASALPYTVRPEDAPGKKRDLKKGIMWGCVGGGGSVMDKFKMVKDAGFDGIEIDSAMNQEEVLKAREATGLQLPTVVCFTHWRQPISSPIPSVRKAGMEGFKNALRDAKAYGSSSILFVPALVNKETPYDAAYTRSQEGIREVLPLAEELGVKIGIENVWNNFLLSPLEAARYIDEFKNPAMAWHFDIGNCINNGWPEQWIHILNTRIHKLHLKEYSRKKRDADGLWKGFQVEYLTGDDDWPTVMRALDDIGYKGWATAEPAYKPPGVDEPTRMKQVSKYLDQIFAL
jgi:hexulose-6-phosphate isomerase